MSQELAKAALWWIIVTQGEPIERRIRTKLKAARTPSRRALLESELQVVRLARKNPAEFVERAGTAYGDLVKIYREYSRGSR